MVILKNFFPYVIVFFRLTEHWLGNLDWHANLDEHGNFEELVSICYFFCWTLNTVSLSITVTVTVTTNLSVNGILYTILLVNFSPRLQSNFINIFYSCGCDNKVIHVSQSREGFRLSALVVRNSSLHHIMWETNRGSKSVFQKHSQKVKHFCQTPALS